MLTIFCKQPISPMKEYDGLRRLMMTRVLVSVFQV